MPVTIAQKNRFLRMVSKSMTDCMGRCSKIAQRRREGMLATLEKRNTSRKSYSTSAKGKESRKNYAKSTKGKESRKKYRTSEKGKASRSKYLTGRREKLAAAQALASMAG